MQGAFISAMVYPPPSIMGKRMLPFSPFHGLMLESIGSPFLRSNAGEFGDLIAALWICSCSYSPEILIGIDKKEIVKWGRKSRKADYAGEYCKFVKYLENSFFAPDCWKSGGGKIKAPFWWHCALFGMERLHLSELEAWNFPLAKYMCLQVCASELVGESNLITDEESAVLQDKDK